jgi:hypothetical protein
MLGEGGGGAGGRGQKNGRKVSCIFLWPIITTKYRIYTKMYVLEKLKKMLQTHPKAQFPVAVPPLLVHSLDVKQVPFKFELKCQILNRINLSKTFSCHEFLLTVKGI